MPKRDARPDDVALCRWPTEAAVSPDGLRVAWMEVALDVERDEPVSSIFVAPSDGSSAPRRFSHGSHDRLPRWSPDGRFLAYLSAESGLAQLKLAPLDGGEPATIALPGPVKWIEWSPSGDRLVLVVNVECPEHEKKDDPVSRNVPRVVRGTFHKLDGVGWFDGRDHLFVYELSSGQTRQLTSGDYDHDQPAFSPDGSVVAFVSDRSSSRDDRRNPEIWTMPVRARGGRKRVASDVAEASYPTFSPDGRHLAFAGLLGRSSTAAKDTRLLVVPADGSSEPVRVAPNLDRPVAFGLGGRPFAWVDSEELVFTVADRGAVDLRRAKLADRGARALLGGDRQVEALSIGSLEKDRILAFTSVWVDSPPEVYSMRLGRRSRSPVRLSTAGRSLGEQLRLRPARRYWTSSPDGLEVEYLVVSPARPRGKSGPKPPLLLDIHGGPHLYNPIGETFITYQVMAAAGYAVVMANPRGSNSYGQEFTLLGRGDWGEGPFSDLMACADDAIARGLADRRRQFVAGYSYGGYMSSWIVGHTKRFRAAAVGAPVTSLASMFGTSDAGSYFGDALSADPWEDHDHFRAQSPIAYAPATATPVYLYVNEGDLRCPPTQADELYAALKWNGKEVEYVRYPGGSHLSAFPPFGPPSQNVDRLERVLSFFARHGGPKPTAKR